MKTVADGFYGYHQYQMKTGSDMRQPSPLMVFQRECSSVQSDANFRHHGRRPFGLSSPGKFSVIPILSFLHNALSCVYGE